MGELESAPVMWDASLSPEGSYLYLLSVTTTLGITNVTGAQWVVIDRSAPAGPTITYPVPRSFFSQPATPVRGTAEPGAIVSVFNDGVFWETASTGADGQWELPRTLPVLGRGLLEATHKELHKRLSTLQVPREHSIFYMGMKLEVDICGLGNPARHPSPKIGDLTRSCMKCRILQQIQTSLGTK